MRAARRGCWERRAGAMEEMMMFFYELLVVAGSSVSRLLGRSERTPQPCPRKTSGGRRLPPERCNQPKRSVNVAVTGPVGSGKSSLIRAMVGGDPEGEEKTPPAGEGAPKSYPFPPNPRVLLWDVPGMEVGESQEGDDVDELDLRSYDFFVLTTSSRMSNEVLELAREIERLDKRFIFVRTKIDLYVRNTRQQNFNQADLLREIRRHFVKKLQSAGIQGPRVFLLSALHTNSFDFHDFMQAFSGEFSSRG